MRRPGSPFPVAVLLVGALAVFVAVATIWTGHRLATVEAQRDAQAATARSVSVVAEAMRAAIKQAALEAAAASGSEVASGGDPGGTTATAAVARDEGRPVLDEIEEGVLVVAVYDTAEIPATVQARRDHVVGYRTVPLDLKATLRRLVPAGGGIAVNGPHRRLVTLPAGAEESSASATVAFAPDTASEWSLTMWTAPPQTPLTAWIVAIGYLLAGGAVGGMIAVRQRASQRRQAELTRLQQSSASIAALAVVAQQSLDLGEALPGVTVELSSSLGLRGLALTSPTTQGELDFFNWGTPPDRSRASTALGEASAGQTLCLPLARGGRTVATLYVVVGRDLDRHDLSALVAARELVTAALVNAEAFAQQRDLVARMRAVDELKSVFLATASHELRTPVVAIAGYAGMLHSSWDDIAPDQARLFVERVDRSAQALSQMVEDLLDFSRLERGHQMGVGEAELDLGEMVRQVLSEQQHLGVDHDVVNRTARGLMVRGSRQSLERIITNLVGNAAKYSPVGTQIRVLTQVVGGEVELIVEDDGPGIPVSEREQVFSRFYRGSGDEVTRTRGTGLGLAIVTEFAASMGGRISVGEAASGGARFVVAFPLVAPPGAHPPAVSVTADPSAPGATHDPT